MNQSKLESLLEQFVNIFFKFWVAVSFWKWAIIPLAEAGYLDFSEPLPITVLFTVLSLAQGYFWRRVFNAGLHDYLKKWVAYFYRERTI
jgi:hypothetical protein